MPRLTGGRMLGVGLVGAGSQKLLGHANINTTRIYTHLDFQQLSKVYDVAHPRTRRKY